MAKENKIMNSEIPKCSLKDQVKKQTNKQKLPLYWIHSITDDAEKTKQNTKVTALKTP